MAASSKLDQWVTVDGRGCASMQPVNLLVCGRTDLGYKAVVDGTHLGLIFKTEVLQPLRMGQKLKGFVRRVREDGRLDLCLQKQGQEVREELAELIRAHAAPNGGVSPLYEHSTQEAHHAVYKLSKSN